MKKTFFFAIILFAAMLTACAAQPASTPTQPLKATSTASNTSTLTAATVTATRILATSTPAAPCPTTQCATIQPLPTKTGTKTASPSPTANIREDCIRIETKMPDGLALSGMWVVNNIPPFLEDIQTHTRNGIRMGGGGNISDYRGGMAITPDGKTLAYIDTYISISGSGWRQVARSTKRILRVIRSSGYVLNMDYWTTDWQSIIGWVDNENIALAIGKTDIIILNPATGKWHKFEQPAWALANYQKNNWYDYPYSPTLQWFLEPPDYREKTQHFKNVQSGQTTWQTTDYVPHATWSANGTSVALSPKDVILILKNGIQTDRLETGRLGYDRTTYLQFSPDGQKLAFSSSKKIGSDYYNTQTEPTLYNTAQHKLGRLCAAGIATSDWGNPAVWSPDSRYFIQAVHEVALGRYSYYNYGKSRYILVDTDEMRAYFLENGPSGPPIAWLAKP